MEPWLAALIVGGVVLLIGVIMLLKGASNMKGMNLKPERTLETLKDDARLAAEPDTMTTAGRSPEDIQTRDRREAQASLARTIASLERKLVPSDILEEVTTSLRAKRQ